MGSIEKYSISFDKKANNFKLKAKVGKDLVYTRIFETKEAAEKYLSKKDKVAKIKNVKVKEEVSDNTITIKDVRLFQSNMFYSTLYLMFPYNRELITELYDVRKTQINEFYNDLENFL